MYGVFKMMNKLILSIFFVCRSTIKCLNQDGLSLWEGMEFKLFILYSPQLTILVFNHELVVDMWPSG